MVAFDSQIKFGSGLSYLRGWSEKQAEVFDSEIKLKSEITLTDLKWSKSGKLFYIIYNFY